MFHENDVHALPHDPSSQARDNVTHVGIHGGIRQNHLAVNIGLNAKDLESFPDELEQFACDIMIFREALNAFPEIFEEAIDEYMLPFENDLRVRASIYFSPESTYLYS